ncbi:MAG: type I 3-dehydroquinate dehydratase [Phycisphaerales bacterium]
MLICAPVLAHDVETALADAGLAREGGADLVEYRLDGLFHGEGDEDGRLGAMRVVQESPLPCIVTCRPVSEGGEYDGDDASRVSLFEALATLERAPAYLDVEWSTWERSANLRQKVLLCVAHPGQRRDVGTRLILSFHDFGGRPADLLRRVERMSREHPGGEEGVVKVAYRARSVRDALEVFDLLRERSRPMIAMAMGEAGVLSRVVGGKFGALLGFAPVRASAATAEGQVTLGEMTGLYRAQSVRETTRVYGVIGWPVRQSLSPLVHNTGFHAAGVEHDGVFVPLPVAESWEAFKASVLELMGHEGVELCGAAVTSPHKEHLVRLAREEGWEIEERAGRIGAANTLVVEGARARVLNTDAPAVAGWVRAGMGEVKGKRIGVLGAGGAARAAVCGLKDEGAEVVVFARRGERAEALGKEFGVAWGAWEGLGESGCEGVVHCTPAGMQGGGQEGVSAVPRETLVRLRRGCARGAPVVFDTVYNPLRTELMETAQGCGCEVVDGVGMFVRQAEMQFREWTGREAPSGLFARLVRTRLVGEV